MSDKIIHLPVMKDEVTKLLNIKPTGTYVDCTGGFGGHSKAILSNLTKGKLICIDQDMDAIIHLTKLFKENKNIEIMKNNFSEIKKIIKKPVDGFLLDLGVSSYMFDEAKRGFSYHLDGPLDMRMNQEQELTAEKIVNEYSQQQLIDIFKNFGEINKPIKVVNAIIKQRTITPIKSTHELVKIIKDNCSKDKLFQKKHPARTYFQALRIAVNNELEIIEKTIMDACELLKPNGVIAIITFHSLEDRIVKQTFNKLTKDVDLIPKDVPMTDIKIADFVLLTKHPVIPQNTEINMNYRSHSAKLRAIQKKQGHHHE